MPKCVPKIGFPGHVSEGLEFVISYDQMLEIQAAYGHELSIEAWAKVKIATALAKLAINAERQQMPVKVFLQKLQGLQALAHELRYGICDQPLLLAQSKASAEANKVVPDFSGPDRPNPNLSDSLDLILFPRLMDVLDELTTVSELVAKEISKPTYKGFRKGVAWNEWICLLTLIVKEHALPFEGPQRCGQKGSQARVAICSICCRSAATFTQ